MPDAKAAKEKTSEGSEQDKAIAARGRGFAIETTTLAFGRADRVGACGCGSATERKPGGVALRRALHDGAQLDRALSGGRGRGARSDAAAGDEEVSERSGDAPRSDPGNEGRAAAGGEPSHSRRDEALSRHRGFGDDGAAGTERRARQARAFAGEAEAAGEGASLRASRAQSTLAVGSLHVPLAPTRAGVRRSVSR